MAVEVFGNVPTTTVTSGGTTAPAAGTQETWTVASSAGFPAASSSALPPTQFHIADVALNSEMISVINVSGTTWTVIRGDEGTTPVAHGAGFTIYQVASAGAYTQLRAVDWLNVVTQFGADPTGSADSTTAIQNAVNALSASAGGVVYLPAGTFKVSSTLTMSNLLYASIRGDGRWASMLKFTGTGDCLRVFNTDTTGKLTGGGLADFTIDGTSAGAGSAGLHYGDMRAGELRIAVQNFSGAGSIGVHLDNQNAWTEETTGYLWLSNNTQNLVFDVSGNATATASFGYTDLATEIIAKANQDGVVLQNGALLYNSRLAVRANFAGSGSAQSNAVLRITGTLPAAHSNTTTTVASGSNGGTISTIASWSSPSAGVLAVASTTGFPAQGIVAVAASGATTAIVTYTGTTAGTLTGCAYVSGSPSGTVSTGGAVSVINGSALNSCRLDIQAECSSSGGGNAPQTIAFGTLGINKLLGCTGIMDFAQGTLAFVVSNWTSLGSAGSFVYDGAVRGDFNLNNATVGIGTSYSMTSTGVRTYGKSLLGTNSGNLFVDAGDFFSTTLTQSITISLNPSGASTLAGAQRKTVIIAQAASGGPYTVAWPSTGSPTSTNCTVTWPGGVAPAMPAAPGATLVVNLVTYDGATWYGQALQGGAPSDPLPPWMASDAGLLAENFDPAAAAGTIALTAGTLYLVRLNIRAAMIISNVVVNVTSAASGTSTQTFAGLYSSAGTLLSGSSDVATPLKSTGNQALALTTPQALAAGIFVWAAILVNLGTTQPTLARASVQNLTFNGSLTTSNYRTCVNGTGLTALPSPITVGSNTLTGSSPLWAAAS